MKLARKLTLALLLGTWSVLAVHAFFEVERERAAFEEDLVDDLRIIGRALRPAVQRIWQREGQVLALQVLDYEDETRRRVNIRWVWLHAPPGETQRPVLGGEYLALARRGEEVAWIDDADGDGIGRIYLYVPVKLESLPAGALELSESLAQEKNYLRTTITRLAVTTGAMALVSGIVAVWIGIQLVGRPMLRLTERARKIGEGDLQGRLDLPQADEIGELAREMDAMAERLQQAQGRIREETGARISAMEQLRHADRLMTVGKLASGIAHELGTPLNVVSGRAKMIQVGEVQGDEVAQNARIIVEQAERMTRIIRQLLDFARARPARKDAAYLGQLVLQTSTLLKPMAEKRRVAVHVDLESNLPQVAVDEGQLMQVFTNLVVNALHAMPEGGDLFLGVNKQDATPPPEVGGAMGVFQAVTVRDTGTGISPENLARIFEPFFTTKEVGDGTGLGLSVAWGIVRDHGGWIGVHSEQGRGTTFTVYLPQA